jgi:hypothetical protein
MILRENTHTVRHKKEFDKVLDQGYIEVGIKLLRDMIFSGKITAEFDTTRKSIMKVKPADLMLTEVEPRRMGWSGNGRDGRKIPLKEALLKAYLDDAKEERRAVVAPSFERIAALLHTTRKSECMRRSILHQSAKTKEAAANKSTPKVDACNRCAATTHITANCPRKGEQCLFCYSNGHVAETCFARIEEEEIGCYSCGWLGHNKLGCPHKNSVCEHEACQRTGHTADACRILHRKTGGRSPLLKEQYITSNPKWLPAHSKSPTVKLLRQQAVIKEKTANKGKSHDGASGGGPAAAGSGGMPTALLSAARKAAVVRAPPVVTLSDEDLAEAARPVKHVWATYAVDKPNATTKHQSVATQLKRGAWGQGKKSSNNPFTPVTKPTEYAFRTQLELAIAALPYPEWKAPGANRVKRVVVDKKTGLIHVQYASEEQREAVTGSAIFPMPKIRTGQPIARGGSRIGAQSTCSVHHFGDDTEGSGNVVTITIHDMNDQYQVGNFEAVFSSLDRLMAVGKYKEQKDWNTVSRDDADEALQVMPADQRIDLDRDTEFFSAIQLCGEPGVGVRVSSQRIVVRVRFAPGVTVPSDETFYDYTTRNGQTDTERIVLAVTRGGGQKYEAHWVHIDTPNLSGLCSQYAVMLKAFEYTAEELKSGVVKALTGKQAPVFKRTMKRLHNVVKSHFAQDGTQKQYDPSRMQQILGELGLWTRMSEFEPDQMARAVRDFYEGEQYADLVAQLTDGHAPTTLVPAQIKQVTFEEGAVGTQTKKNRDKAGQPEPQASPNPFVHAKAPKSRKYLLECTLPEKLCSYKSGQERNKVISYFHEQTGDNTSPTWRVDVDIAPRVHQMLYDKVLPIVSDLQKARDATSEDLEDDDKKKMEARAREDIDQAKRITAALIDKLNSHEYAAPGSPDDTGSKVDKWPESLIRIAWLAQHAQREGVIFLKGSNAEEVGSDEEEWLGIVPMMFAHEARRLEQNQAKSRTQDRKVQKLYDDVSTFYEKLNQRVADAETMWSDAEKQEFYKGLSKLLEGIMCLHEYKLLDSRLGGPELLPSDKMDRVAKEMLQGVIERKEQNRWDVKAVCKCVRGTKGTKSAAESFDALLRSIDIQVKSKDKAAAEVREAIERKDKRAADLAEIEVETTRKQAAVVQEELKQQNLRKAAEEERRREEAAVATLAQILDTPSTHTKLIMQNMKRYPWTTRCKMAPVWTLMPPGVLEHVMTSQLFGTPEEGANLRQGVPLEARTTDEFYAILSLLEKSLCKMGQQLREVLREYDDTAPGDT